MYYPHSVPTLKQPTDIRTSRRSNIELLRIVSMIMVLAVHIDGASLGLPQPAGDVAGLDSRDVWRLAVESLTIIGVNCFTMISGYFSITLRWRSVAAYLFQCIFYAVGIYSAVFLFVSISGYPAGGHLSWSGWLESWLVLSHTDLWYVPAYFGLMLLSPLLNAGVDRLSRPTFRIVLAVFVAFNIWCGWLWHGSFNPTGYTLIQLIMVYLCARYIRLHLSAEWTRNHRPALSFLWFGSVIAVFVSSLYLDTSMAFAYNSPFVLLSTVSFFLMFLSLDFRSRAVNYVARSAFAVYLIHKSPLIWGNMFKPFVAGMWRSMSLGEFTLAAVVLIAVTYLLAMGADAVRRALSRILIPPPSSKRT